MRATLQLLSIFSLLSFAAAGNGNAQSKRNFASGCKCAPSDPCWPSLSTWKAFNSSIKGKLIRDIPPAIVCYNGPQNDPAACAKITTELTNSSFVGTNPIALDYPIGDACPAIVLASGTTNETCSLGDAPVYTVNATTTADVVAGVNFARTHNLRLVVRNTGHDILGRSTGYGSLQIWIRYFRQGITFQNAYLPSDKCEKSGWTGSAFVIGGGYTWRDVYPEASKNNVIVVGGGDPSVGCIGGWAQGGGHSPATRNYGLGADQILEAQVVLASGAAVTANACQNQDIFFAIRGGGGGTYGVVTSTTVKAHPNTKIVAQTLAIAPLNDTFIPQFMEALEIIYSAFPDLNDGGYSGYGSWAVQSFAPVFANFTTGYQHAIAVFGETLADAAAIWKPVADKLEPYTGTSLFTSTSYLNFTTYAEYYSTLSGGQVAVGTSGAIGSRLLPRHALTSPKLPAMLNTTAGLPGQFTQTSICLVSGGQVFKDASDPNSVVNPAWRKSYVHNIVARGWAPGSSAEEVTAVHRDISDVKVGAMRDLTPDTGCYMNEADRFDEKYLEDFYGGSLGKLQVVKAKYDPLSVFYCPTCVGSNHWEEDETGRLCPVS